MEKRWLEDTEYVARCLAGKELFGDSFSPEDISLWVQLESQAYAGLAASGEEYRYGFHELDRLHGFKHLPSGSAFDRVLGFGSAYGDEILPIADRCGDISIVEPGDVFWKHRLGEKKVAYTKPAADGELPFEDDSFDLVLCFSALHHVPNVSKVIGEFSRVMKSGSWLLVREPISSMGDWFQENRKGTTKCERGIPRALMEGFIQNSGLSLQQSKPCDFTPWIRFLNLLGVDTFNNRLATRADAVLSKAFSFNNVYYATNVFQKFRPSSRYYICRKGA